MTTACALVKREAYLQVGGFNENLAVTFNDVDLCLRLREAGYRILWTPYAELIHHESASRGFDNSAPEFHNALLKLVHDEEPIVRRNAALALVRFSATGVVSVVPSGR